MPSSRFWPDRLGGAAGRLVLSVILGGAVLFAMPGRWPWVMRTLAGWDAGAAASLAMCWRVMLRADGPATRGRCRLNDASRPVVDALLTAATLASVGAVCVALREVSDKDGPLRTTGVVVGVGVPILAVVLAWLLVHTLYALHYARLYYHNDEDPDGPPFGGLDLHEDPPDEPDYRDFLYLAFAIACTFGVTDVRLTSKAMRRVVTQHSVLSFALATIVLALAVNVITTLLAGGK